MPDTTLNQAVALRLTLALILTAVILAITLINPIYYNYTIFRADDGSYLHNANEFAKFSLPEGVHRPPLYPFLLYITTNVDRPWTSAMMSLHIILIYVTITLIIYYVMDRGYWMERAKNGVPPGAWFRSILMALIASFFVTAAMAHASLYTAIIGPETVFLVLVTCGSVLVAMGTWRSAWCVALGSALAGLSLWAKPSSIGLLIVLLLAANWFRAQGNGRNALAAVLPFFCVVLLLAAYNAVTVGWFNYTGFGSWSMLRGTVMFFENKDSYPPSLQESISKFNETSGVKEDREHLRTSWNLYQIAKSERPHTGFGIVEKKYFEPWFESEDISGGWKRFAATNKIYREMALHNIKSHPLLYLKMVLARAYYYFLDPNFVIHDTVVKASVPARGLDRRTYRDLIENKVNSQLRLITVEELRANKGRFDMEREHVLQAEENEKVTIKQKENNYEVTLSKSPLWDVPSQSLGALFLVLIPFSHWIMLGCGVTGFLLFAFNPKVVPPIWFAPLFFGLSGAGLKGITVFVASWNSRYLASDILLPVLAAVTIIQTAVVLVRRRQAHQAAPSPA
jgi:hypothetical protein